MQDKLNLHKKFWQGEGPSLMLMPAAEVALYDLDDYPARFYNPRAMWESEMRRAEPLVDWPTDGIPTVRPNLGVIFIPVMAGLGYSLPENQMPWPGEHLAPDDIRKGRNVDITQTELMALAAEFYAIHKEEGGPDIAAYHADTQGVFDVAHLLAGHDVLVQLLDPSDRPWMDELLALSADLVISTTKHLKTLIGEDNGTLIHGHGNPQGVYFPHAGLRMCEDTATLLSPPMLQMDILPAIQKVADHFGGGVFSHFCGCHKPFFEMLCKLECTRAIDLGNPEMYDTRWLLEQCGQTGTVLYSKISALPEEGWEAYTRRIAGLVQDTGARCILRPAVYPDNRAACEDMVGLWHELTV